MTLRTLRRATLLTLLLGILGTVQYYIIFHILTNSRQHDHQVAKEISQGVMRLKELEFEEWHSKKVKRLVGRRRPTTEPVVREGEGRILPGNFQRVGDPPAAAVRFPLDQGQSIEGHSSQSTPRVGLITLSSLSENTGKLMSSYGNHRSPLLAKTPKQEALPSSDSVSNGNATLLGNTLNSVSGTKSVSRGQSKEPLRRGIERRIPLEVTGDVHSKMFSRKEIREPSSMKKVNHIDGGKLSTSVRELAGSKPADQLAGRDERDLVVSMQPTSGQLSNVDTQRAGEASSINSHRLTHIEDAISVVRPKVPNHPKSGYNADRIPKNEQRTNFVDKQLPDSNLEYDREKQLLFQYIMETNPHWLDLGQNQGRKDRNEKDPEEQYDYEYEEEEYSEEEDNKINYDDFELIQTEQGIKIVRKPKPTFGPEIVVENDTRPFRSLTPFEEEGGNIMFTLRTTLSYHQARLPLLFETWMTKVNCSRIYLVTDGPSKEWVKKARKIGMHYVVASCGKSYFRNELCCKAGVELAMMFKPQNRDYDWLCHIDDDMYINLEPLVRILSKFDPKKEPVYFGRSGSDWFKPRKVKSSAKLGTPGQRYHFAVGGMYCLSRAMLEMAKPYLVGGDAFASSCSKTREPEDVTVGFIVGVVLNRTLSRTELIHTHGLHLVSSVDPFTLKEQIAFSYGFGSTKWGEDSYNAIYVPDGVYSIEKDESQFRSLFCHLYPEEPQCAARIQEINNNPDFSPDFSLY